MSTVIVFVYKKTSDKDRCLILLDKSLSHTFISYLHITQYAEQNTFKCSFKSFGIWEAYFKFVLEVRVRKQEFVKSAARGRQNSL